MGGGSRPRAIVVGGGLAGMAAAGDLAEAGIEVVLLEARRKLGGRAASFRDPATGELIDHCQHVSLGCCTNLADLCRRIGVAGEFERHERLLFIGPDGKSWLVAPAKWLPVPFHLAPSLMRLGYLTTGQRLRAARTLWRLARYSPVNQPEPTLGDWLRQQGESTASIDYLWSVFITSALGESLENVAVSPARKVMVDGFMAARSAMEMLVPKAPLSKLFGDRAQLWLESLGVTVRTSAVVDEVLRDGASMLGVRLSTGEELRSDAVIVAAAWRAATALLPWVPNVAATGALAPSPITGVHLWFDRPVAPVRHAVLVGRLGQWVFRPEYEACAATGETYYQVVISASRNIEDLQREEVARSVAAELASIWPRDPPVRLVRWRVVTEPEAVFSASPRVEQLRPGQRIGGGLYLAGDWTRTGWPSTMEGAVRSGHLAAEAVLGDLGRPRELLVPDLARGRLSRWLLG